MPLPPPARPSASLPDRLPKRVKAMVFYASSLSGNLNTVYNIVASINRMRFAEELSGGQRLHAKWVRRWLIWKPITIVISRVVSLYM